MAIYRASHSAWLVRLISPLWESSQRYTLARDRPLAMRQKEHQQIVAAVRAREPETAGRLIHDHLAVTGNLLAVQMGEKEMFPLLGNG
jgi:DNA-binding GntR family transcriptional regulator